MAAKSADGPEGVQDRLRDGVIRPLTGALARLPGASAARIPNRLRDGTMPCDGAWPGGRIEIFARWLDAGAPTSDARPDPRSPMIVEYVRYQVPVDRRAEFEAGYASARAGLDASAYCLGYELSRCVEDPGWYVLRIRWTSAEDHLTRFRGSPEFLGFFHAVSPFVSLIEEMRHYEPTAVVSDAPHEHAPGHER